MPARALPFAIFVLLSLAYAAVVRVVAGGAGFPLDDAYIHLQFARNLHESGVMAFNAGVPSSGCSAPGYPVVLAGAFFFVRDWRVASYIVGVLAALLSVALGHRILLQWTRDRAVARFGALLLVLSYPTVVLAYAGMEAPLYVAAYLGGLFLYGRGDQKARLLASAVFVLGVWFRPELLLMAPLVGVERWLGSAARGDRRGRAAELARHAVIWGAGVAAYVVYHFMQDGHLVPSTFAAKAVAQHLGIVNPLYQGLPAAFARGRWGSMLLAATVWPAVVLLSAWAGLVLSTGPVAFAAMRSARAIWSADDATGPPRRLALMTLIAFPVVRGAIDPTSLFVYQLERYFAHLMPSAVLLGAATWAASTTAPAKTKRWTVSVALAANLLGIIYASFAVSNVNTMHVGMARWIEANVPKTGLVAANDIGAIGFLTRRPVLDLIGLVEPRLVDHHLAGRPLTTYVELRRPDLLAIFPHWFPSLSSSPHWRPVHSIRVSPNVICGADEVVLFARTPFPHQPPRVFENTR